MDINATAEKRYKTILHLIGTATHGGDARKLANALAGYFIVKAIEHAESGDRPARDVCKALSDYFDNIAAGR